MSRILAANLDLLDCHPILHCLSHEQLNISKGSRVPGITSSQSGVVEIGLWWNDQLEITTAHSVKMSNCGGREPILQLVM